MKTCFVYWLAAFLVSFAPFARAATLEELAARTSATENKAPDWIKHGAYVYRILTPDDADTLVSVEKGLAITCHLLDSSIEQIPIINGLIGDDHRGGQNWDGIWPYWNRVSFCAQELGLPARLHAARERQVQHEGLVPREPDRCQRRAEGLSRDAGVLQQAGANRVHLSPRLESRDQEAGRRTALRAARFPRQGKESGRDLRAGELQTVLGQRHGPADARRVLPSSSLSAAGPLRRRADIGGGQLQYRLPHRPLGRQQGNAARRGPGDREIPEEQRHRGGHGRGSPLPRGLRDLRLAALPDRRLRRRLRQDQGRGEGRSGRHPTRFREHRMLRRVPDRLDSRPDRQGAGTLRRAAGRRAERPENAGPRHLARRRSRERQRRVQHVRGGGRRRPLPRRLDRPDKRFLPYGHPGALSCRQGQRAYARLQQDWCPAHQQVRAYRPDRQGNRNLVAGLPAAVFPGVGRQRRPAIRERDAGKPAHHSFQCAPGGQIPAKDPRRQWRIRGGCTQRLREPATPVANARYFLQEAGRLFPGIGPRRNHVACGREHPLRSIRARSTRDGATARWPSGKRPPWARASKSPTAT